MSTAIDRYADYLNNISGNILLGCDGFVDEVYNIVDVRRSLNDFTAMDKVKQFGDLIVERADGGVGLEIVHIRRCSGGFTPNTGRVAAMLGLRPTITGLYGANGVIDPAFHEFIDNCNILSLGDPAVTLVFEFPDGKLLMSDLKSVATLTWTDFVSFFGYEKLKDMFSNTDILGLGYWSLTPDFDNFLKGFVAQADTTKPPRRMFFDFADIKKKADECFEETAALIREFNSTIPMTLSLNEHEVSELFRRVGVDCPPDEPEATAKALTVAREKMGIDELVVHTPAYGAASNASDGEGWAVQNTQTNVIRTAGAGDTFNGGYLCASLGDLSVKERLVIANAATAFFVTRAAAPNTDELIAQIEEATDR
jgi:sugar/nucleoside kinase (ribokinase family)